MSMSTTEDTMSVEPTEKTPEEEESTETSDKLTIDDKADNVGNSIVSTDEDITVDTAVVDKLSTSFLCTFLPELQKGQSVLREVLQNQEILIESVQHENSKFSTCSAMGNLSEMMVKARTYHNKLLNVKREMGVLDEKSFRLKKRALKLQQQKQKEDLQRAQQKEKDYERERALTAKVAKKPSAFV